MSTSSIIALAVAYTFAVAAMVEFADVSGAVVLAVSWAWYSIGRMVGRRGATITRWGRQP